MVWYFSGNGLSQGDISKNKQTNYNKSKHREVKPSKTSHAH